jgi:hypothetical protein
LWFYIRAPALRPMIVIARIGLAIAVIAVASIVIAFLAMMAVSIAWPVLAMFVHPAIDLAAQILNFARKLLHLGSKFVVAAGMRAPIGNATWFIPGSAGIHGHRTVKRWGRAAWPTRLGWLKVKLPRGHSARSTGAGRAGASSLPLLLLLLLEHLLDVLRQITHACGSEMLDGLPEMHGTLAIA